MVKALVLDSELCTEWEMAISNSKCNIWTTKQEQFRKLIFTYLNAWESK